MSYIPSQIMFEVGENWFPKLQRDVDDHPWFLPRNLDWKWILLDNNTCQTANWMKKQNMGMHTSTTFGNEVVHNKLYKRVCKFNFQQHK